MITTTIYILFVIYIFFIIGLFQFISKLDIMSYNFKKLSYSKLKFHTPKIAWVLIGTYGNEDL